MNHRFDLQGRNIVITGGTGTLGFTLARGFAGAGARILILSRDKDRAEKFVRDLGEKHLGTEGNVLDETSLRKALKICQDQLGNCDVLVNCAGGNVLAATTTDDVRFFDLPREGIKEVTDVNLLGTILPAQVFGEAMATRKKGCILNITSMAAMRPLTRVMGYSAAKAGVQNFTQWLAVHLAQEYSPNIRVNAIAPGFFITDQNRYLLHDQETGEWSERGRKILEHTPQSRFGEPEDLVGAAIWLVSDAAAFVTGAVIPVDGGFSAFGGV